MLYIYDSGASSSEIERGVEAAAALFRDRGIDPSAARAARLAAADGQPYIPELAQAWDDAEVAAFEAAFADWARWPEGATLGLA